MKNSLADLEFHVAEIKDLPSIMRIIQEAQALLASLVIDQWQDGYPEKQVIRDDISNLESFVVSNKKGEIMATVMFTTSAEPTYNVIEGKWLTDQASPYGVIHRMAVGALFRSQGIAKYILESSEHRLREDHIESMRIDTHEDNFAMQSLLANCGYSYCGIIFLHNGDRRLAFEKLMR